MSHISIHLLTSWNWATIFFLLLKIRTGLLLLRGFLEERHRTGHHLSLLAQANHCHLCTFRTTPLPNGGRHLDVMQVQTLRFLHDIHDRLDIGIQGDVGDHTSSNLGGVGDHTSSNLGGVGDHTSSNRGDVGDHTSSNRGGCRRPHEQQPRGMSATTRAATGGMSATTRAAIGGMSATTRAATGGRQRPQVAEVSTPLPAVAADEGGSRTGRQSPHLPVLPVPGQSGWPCGASHAEKGGDVVQVVWLLWLSCWSRVVCWTQQPQALTDALRLMVIFQSSDWIIHAYTRFFYLITICLFIPLLFLFIQLDSPLIFFNISAQIPDGTSRSDAVVVQVENLLPTFQANKSSPAVVLWRKMRRHGRPMDVQKQTKIQHNYVSTILWTYLKAYGVRNSQYASSGDPVACLTTDVFCTILATR